MRARKSRWPPRWPTSSWNAWTLRANSENSRLREKRVCRDERNYLDRSHACFCSHAYLYATLKLLLASKAMCRLLLGSLRCSTGAFEVDSFCVARVRRRACTHTGGVRREIVAFAQSPRFSREDVGDWKREICVRQRACTHTERKSGASKPDAARCCESELVAQRRSAAAREAH